MPFRWQGKHLLLTWPQSDFSLDGCQDFLRHSFERATFIRVSSERHADGELHRHAYLNFPQRFSFTNERRADFGGRHAHIQLRINNPAAALTYVSKDGDFIDWGEIPDLDEVERKESRNELWGRLLDEATDASNFLQLVREASPYDFCTRYQQLDAMARAVFKPPAQPVPEFDPEDFDLPDTITGWMEEEFNQEVSHRDLLTKRDTS